MSSQNVNMHLPFPWNSPGTLRQSRDRSAEELGVARCPLCRHPLVARLDRQGPYFFCQCPRRRPPPVEQAALPVPLDGTGTGTLRQELVIGHWSLINDHRPTTNDQLPPPVEQAALPVLPMQTEPGEKLPVSA